MQKEKKYADVFGNNPNITTEERERVCAELKKIGSLTFKVEASEEGWVARSAEIDGLIAGNNNPNPSPLEIESGIRDAIYAAFNVKFESFPSPVKIEYSLV